MDIFKTEIFKTITGDMLLGSPVVMTIRGVEVEKITNESGTNEKPCLYFEKSKKPLVLNATNAKKLAKAFGRETNAWRGAKVELYAEEIKAFGKVQNAVRLNIVEKPPVLTADQHKARRVENAALMHPQDDGTIGEQPAVNGNGIGESDWERFVSRVKKEIPFFTTEGQIRLALAGLEYEAETEEMCFDELAQVGNRQADLQAA